jgi:hypothetical protein
VNGALEGTRKEAAGSCVNSVFLHPPAETKENLKISVRFAGGWTEIKTLYLPNTKNAKIKDGLNTDRSLRKPYFHIQKCYKRKLIAFCS